LSQKTLKKVEKKPFNHEQTANKTTNIQHNIT